MSTLELINHVAPGRVSRFNFAPNGPHNWTPFMDGYIVWNGAPLTEAEVEAKRAEWEASVAADRALSNVITQRKAEYGPIEDQLDMQYWDSVHGTRIWLDHISAVKAKHPKPE